GFIRAPDRMNASGDPIAAALRRTYQQARMPNLGLTEADVAAVIDYLERRSRTPSDAPSTPAEPPAAASAPASGATQTMVDAYLRIQQALFADRMDSLNADARAIEADAAARGSSGDAIRAAAARVKDAGNLAAARSAFGVLSDAMVAAVGGPDQAVSHGLRIAFCPMARKSWLQKGERIENPFYGQVMPDCGRLVTTR